MFREILDKIAHHVDGVRGCVLLDPDSIPVAELYPDETSTDAIQAVAIELANLIGSMRKRDVLVDVGLIDEFSVATAEMTLLCRSVDGNYLLVAALKPEADAVRGRTMLRLMAPWLTQHL